MSCARSSATSPPARTISPGCRVRAAGTAHPPGRSTTSCAWPAPASSLVLSLVALPGERCRRHRSVSIKSYAVGVGASSNEYHLARPSSIKGQFQARGSPGVGTSCGSLLIETFLRKGSRLGSSPRPLHSGHSGNVAFFASSQSGRTSSVSMIFDMAYWGGRQMLDASLERPFIRFTNDDAGVADIVN
jgi:hypothetical protein